MNNVNCKYCNKELVGNQKRFCCNNHKGKFYIKNRTSFHSYCAITRNRAKRRNIEFNLTPQNLRDKYESQCGKCKYTGWPLELGKRDNHQISIDRRDSSLTYTVDNIDIVCVPVQIAKQCLSSSEFIDLCRAVAKNFPET